MRSVVALFRSIATRLDVVVPVTLMTSPFHTRGPSAHDRTAQGRREPIKIDSDESIDRPADGLALVFPGRFRYDPVDRHTEVTGMKMRRRRARR
jgi:hypothetical protein